VTEDSLSHADTAPRFWFEAKNFHPATVDWPNIHADRILAADRVAAATVVPDRDHFSIFSLAKCEQVAKFALSSTSLTAR
jgi:hypothetical protein